MTRATFSAGGLLIAGLVAADWFAAREAFAGDRGVDELGRALCVESEPARGGFWQRVGRSRRPPASCAVLVPARRRVLGREPTTEFERRGLAELADAGAAVGFEARRLLVMRLALEERWEAFVPAISALLEEGLDLDRDADGRLAWARGLAAVGRFPESREAYRPLLLRPMPREGLARLALEFASVDLLCLDGGAAASSSIESAFALGHPKLALFAAGLLEVRRARFAPNEASEVGTEQALQVLSVFEESAGRARDVDSPFFSRSVRAVVGAAVGEALDAELACGRYASLFEERAALEPLFGPRMARVCR